MEFKKCDMCKEISEENGMGFTNVAILDFNVSTLADVFGFKNIRNEFDLCKKCTKKLLKFMGK